MDEYLRLAVDEALTGLGEGGIPIGSVLVGGDGTILGRGRNRRVQDADPVLHAEIDCLRRAGRIGSYATTTLYSTLMPCYLCAGAVVQFGIPRVVAGEATNFAGARDLLAEKGVVVVVEDDPGCVQMLGAFIRDHPELWSEDIGRL